LFLKGVILIGAGNAGITVNGHGSYFVSLGF
jgi:hypothetical protein